jgi:hypothetical protein
MNSTNEAASAANTTMCPHLLESGLQAPFALYHTKKTARYTCPACTVDAIERRLAPPGQEPNDVAQSVSFQNCQHSPGERACWSCLEAVNAELTLRWSRLFYRDKQSANRLRRVASHWNQFYDPHQLKIKGRETAVRRPAMETREERSIRLARQRIERNHAATMKQRGFAKTRAIGSTGQHPQRVTAVRPAQ